MPNASAPYGRATTPGVRAIEIEIGPSAKPVDGRAAETPAKPAEDPAATERPGGHTIEVGAPLDPRFSFDNFVVGKPNELAYAAARRAADSETVPFNPLFLYGGVGLGKTHLMHAIAWHIRTRYPRAQGHLPLGREVHVPVHSRPSIQGRDGVQAAVPFRRRVDDRRRPVHQRQGLDPRGVLPPPSTRWSIATARS